MKRIFLPASKRQDMFLKISTLHINDETFNGIVRDVSYTRSSLRSGKIDEPLVFWYMEDVISLYWTTVHIYNVPLTKEKIAKRYKNERVTVLGTTSSACIVKVHTDDITPEEVLSMISNRYLIDTIKYDINTKCFIIKFRRSIDITKEKLEVDTNENVSIYYLPHNFISFYVGSPFSYEWLISMGDKRYLVNSKQPNTRPPLPDLLEVSQAIEGFKKISENHNSSKSCPSLVCPVLESTVPIDNVAYELSYSTKTNIDKLLIPLIRSGYTIRKEVSNTGMTKVLITKENKNSQFKGKMLLDKSSVRSLSGFNVQETDKSRMIAPFYKQCKEGDNILLRSDLRSTHDSYVLLYLMNVVKTTPFYICGINRLSTGDLETRCTIVQGPLKGKQIPPVVYRNTSAKDTSQLFTIESSRQKTKKKRIDVPNEATFFIEYQNKEDCDVAVYMFQDSNILEQSYELKYITAVGNVLYFQTDPEINIYDGSFIAQVKYLYSQAGTVLEASPVKNILPEDRTTSSQGNITEIFNKYDLSQLLEEYICIDKVVLAADITKVDKEDLQKLCKLAAEKGSKTVVIAFVNVIEALAEDNRDFYHTVISNIVETLFEFGRRKLSIQILSELDKDAINSLMKVLHIKFGVVFLSTVLEYWKLYHEDLIDTNIDLIVEMSKNTKRDWSSSMSKIPNNVDDELIVLDSLSKSDNKEPSKDFALYLYNTYPQLTGELFSKYTNLFVDEELDLNSETDKNKIILYSVIDKPNIRVVIDEAFLDSKALRIISVSRYVSQYISSIASVNNPRKIDKQAIKRRIGELIYSSKEFYFLNFGK